MTIQEALKRLTESGAELYSKICIVNEIDEDARTVDVTPIDEGAPILGVNLQANQDCSTGFVVFPEKDSHVVICFLSDATAVVVLTEKIYKVVWNIGDDKPVEITAENSSLKMTIGDTTIEADDQQQIKFNGGTNDGLVIIKSLTDKINELVDAFNNHTHLLASGAVAVAGSPAAQSNPAPISIPAITSKATKLNKSDYENTKITH